MGGAAPVAVVLDIVGLGGVDGDGATVEAEPTLVDVGAPAAARAFLSAVSPNEPDQTPCHCKSDRFAQLSFCSGPEKKCTKWLASCKVA